MKEQVSQLAKSAVVQYVSERIICIYRRTEVQNKTIARETDKYNYSSGMGTEYKRFLKANYKLQQIYWKLFLPQRKQ